ncbi:MAG: MCE family protein [Hyphomicrobiaceae bacterium]|nr:MCE family protein [Hyphomicrobiaceae bacterium]
METKANHFLIGLFTLVVLAGALGFIYWVVSAGEVRQRAEIIFEFDGPVTGLARGSPVYFNGIKIGEVSELSLDPDDPSRAIALARVDATAPMKADTVAELGIQGLTGIAYVSLSGGTARAPRILDPAVPVRVMARTSAIQDIVEGARRILERADRVIATVENFVVVNEPVLSGAVADVRQVTQAFAENAEGFRELGANISAAAQRIGTISERVDRVAERADQILATINPEDVGAIVANVRVVTEDLTTLGDDARAFLASGSAVVERLDTAAVTLNATLDDARGIVGAIDRQQIERAVANITGFTDRLSDFDTDLTATLTAARGAAENVTVFTERLSGNSERLDRIFADAELIASRLEEASQRVDGILARVDGMLNTEDGQGLVADAREAARALRDVARAFEARSAEIADGLARFSGRGLRDVEAFVADGRRTMSRLDRVLQTLERDPSQIIFGNSGVPEYAPRRR